MIWCSHPVNTHLFYRSSSFIIAWSVILPAAWKLKQQIYVWLVQGGQCFFIRVSVNLLFVFTETKRKSQLLKTVSLYGRNRLYWKACCSLLTSNGKKVHLNHIATLPILSSCLYTVFSVIIFNVCLEDKTKINRSNINKHSSSVISLKETGTPRQAVQEFWVHLWLNVVWWHLIFWTCLLHILALYNSFKTLYI
jgi:hypothetical protein